MTNSKDLTSSEILRDTINEAILEKKGEQIVNLDLRKLYNSITDFFVICQASNHSQMDAIVNEIRRNCREKLNEKVFSSEGINDDPEWILLDYFDVVVHVFSEQGRQKFRLEEVWADADKVSIDDLGNIREK
ncbi:MAG: ribosome silencing factor [Bacteroidota bacterium]|nr:ribosome silencing factor [Bacteroidota bacterium]